MERIDLGPELLEPSRPPGLCRDNLGLCNLGLCRGNCREKLGLFIRRGRSVDTRSRRLGSCHVDGSRHLRQPGIRLRSPLGLSRRRRRPRSRGISLRLRPKDSFTSNRGRHVKTGADNP